MPYDLTGVTSVWLGVGVGARGVLLWGCVCGVKCKVCGAWFVVGVLNGVGALGVVRSVWLVVCGFWPLVLCFAACGLWFVVCGQ